MPKRLAQKTDVPYARGRDLKIESFICRILGVSKYFITRAKAFHLDPPRHYHTFDHALDVAAEVMLAGYEVSIEHPHELLLASIYHDAVFVPGAKDNEAKSGKLAVREIAEFEMEDIDKEYVEHLIRLTAKHFTDLDLSDEEAVFMDADIHGFAAPFDIFCHLQDGIDREFLMVSSHQEVRENRDKFLASLLQRSSIFYSKRGREIFEKTARANLKLYLDPDRPR